MIPISIFSIYYTLLFVLVVLVAHFDLLESRGGVKGWSLQGL